MTITLIDNPSKDRYVPGFRVVSKSPIPLRPDPQVRQDSLTHVTSIRPRDPKVVDLVHKLRLWRPVPYLVYRGDGIPPFVVPEDMIRDAQARAQLPKAPAKYRKYAEMLSAFRPDEWIPPLPQQAPEGSPDPRVTPFTFKLSVEQDFVGVPPSRFSALASKTFSGIWPSLHGVPRPARLTDAVARQHLSRAWLRLTRFEVAIILSQVHDLELNVADQVLPDYRYMAAAAIRESGGHYETAHWPVIKYKRSQLAVHLPWPELTNEAAPPSDVAARGTPFTWQRSLEETFGHLKKAQRQAIGMKAITSFWFGVHNTPLPLERTRERLEAYTVEAWARMTRSEVAKLLSGVSSISESDAVAILPDYRELMAQQGQAAGNRAQVATVPIIIAEVGQEQV